MNSEDAAPAPEPASAAHSARSTRAITPEVKKTWRQRRKDFSAGGVAYRKAESGYEVALIATRGGTRWQLPKGTCEPNESLEETAIREVVEEVGLETRVVSFLRPIEYWYWDTYHRTVPELVHKRVDFFLLQVTGGELTDSCYEVDATGWFPLAQALELLSFSGEQEVMRAAMDYLAAQT
jgi:8-oxo-dGTP pyrophosphatase MutT (NUDIX family)